MRVAGAYSGVLPAGSHSLPLARIKKIMKSSGDNVKMISGDATIVLAKACELFIQELTLRSWTLAAQPKRRTLHRHDVASAVIATDLFDFLIHLVSDSATAFSEIEMPSPPTSTFTGPTCMAGSYVPNSNGATVSLGMPKCV